MAFRKTGLVFKHWRGDYSLARSFWLHYLLVPILIILAILVAQAIVGSQSRYGEYLGSGSMLALLAAYFWGMVGTWRSAKKSPEALCGKLVRIFFGAQLMVMIGGFGLALMYMLLSAISGPPH
jgi:hypothetical protein